MASTGLALRIGVMGPSELRNDGVLGSWLPASNPKQQQRYAVWAMCQNAQFWYGASQEQAEAKNRVPHRRWAPRGVGSQWCNRLPHELEGGRAYEAHHLVGYGGGADGGDARPCGGGLGQEHRSAGGPTQAGC